MEGVVVRNVNLNKVVSVSGGLDLPEATKVTVIETDKIVFDGNARGVSDDRIETDASGVFVLDNSYRVLIVRDDQ